MSRCFPYPPPGYTLSRAQNEALIELIKLQKEKERKKEKKEKRKEKKEKRKEKKERRKAKKDETNQNLNKSDIKNHHIFSKSLSNAKVDCLPKRSESETVQLERSNLTEEHAHPASLSGPSTSSDSTENSNKRKRHLLPLDDTCGHGKVILIRLASKKQNDFDALTKEEIQACSTSGRSDPPAKSRDVNSARDLPANTLKGTSDICQALNLRNSTEQHICSTSTSGQVKGKTGIDSARDLPTNTLKGTSDSCQGFILRNSTEQQICSSSTSGQAQDKTGIKSTPRAVSLTPMQKMDLQYQNILGNCFPPQIENACLKSDDLDWLLKGRSQEHDQEPQAEKRRRCGSDFRSCSRSSGLWARAEYLREVDVYALPFTVPY